MRSITLLTLSLLPLGGLAAQAKPASTILEIRDLVAPLSQESWILPVRTWNNWRMGRYPRLMRIAFQGEDFEYGEEEAKPIPFMDPNTILYLLSATGTSAEREGFSMKDSVLHFAGAKEALTRARARIQDLRQRIAAPISVEVALYRNSDKSPAGVTWLTPSEGEKRMQAFRRGDAKGLLVHEQARVRPGDQVYLGQQRSRVLIASYNVELTETVKSADPVRLIQRYGHGMNLVFEVRPDGLGLGMHFEISLLDVPDKVDSIQVGTDDIQSMERMRHSDHRILGSLNLPNEAAFVYIPQGDAKSRVRALVLVRRKEIPLPTGAGVVLLPHTWLTGKYSHNHAPGIRGEHWLPQRMNLGQIRGTLLDPLSSKREVGLTIPMMDDTHMILEAKPAYLEGTLERLGNLCDQRARNYLVRLGREAWVGGKWIEQGRRLALPVMAHRSTAFVDGEGMSYLENFVPEEGKLVRIMEPQIGLIFAGSMAQVTVIPSGSKLAVHLELEETQLVELRPIKRKGPDKGIIEAPTLEHLQRSVQLELEPEEKRILGSGPDIEIDGKPAKSRLWIQIDALEAGR